MLKKSLQNEPQTASILVRFAKLYREANQAQLNFNRTRHRAGFVVSAVLYKKRHLIISFKINLFIYCHVYFK
ncbi:hypothetical protein, partial [Escherichia coli]|jgi:hypothetical protein|uniref:hypothetical protein n=2 Tax=Escherichia coli TaxID=562 RepID=UPI001BC82E3E